MKKTAFVLLLTVAAAAAEAQTIQDALRFSESNYEGTARTLAMGNAFTALGGDLGAVTINPAGSAVANYSQVTITPGLNISSNIAGGTILPGDSSPVGFGNRLTRSETRFSVPNFGVTMNFDMHRKRGLKNINIGFIANTSDRYQENLMTSGENQTTTFTGSAAYWAGGYDFDQLLMNSAYDSYSAPWQTIVAAQSGMISNLTNAPTEYIGAAEVAVDTDGQTDIHLGGPLDQTYQRQTNGYKYDYVFNIGFNISDFVYFGANLGITSISYDSATRFTEAAIDPYDFENVFTMTGEDGSTQDITTYFSNMRYDYRYSARGTGVYGKFGIIVTPGAGLRIGAAVQTPTSTTITENWSESGATTYLNSTFNMSAESPTGEYSYRLISPFRANFGVAWTFGTFGLISADYEMCDYGTMKFKTLDLDSGEFDTQNSDIRDYMGVSHNIRAGIEIKPVPAFAIRAGYGLTTPAEKAMDENGAIDYIYNIQKNTLRHKGSFGIGYSSPGSFFIDAACSFTRYGNEYILPYDDYIFADDGSVLAYTPEILNKRMLWNVLLTFGFRF